MTTSKQDIIEPGYVAFTGHVFTEAEADAYNHATDEVVRIERMAGRYPSKLAAESVNVALNRRAMIFKLIVLDDCHADDYF
jgi:hypothetical protein